MISKKFWKKLLLLIVCLIIAVITLFGVAAYAFVSKIQVTASENNPAAWNELPAASNIPAKNTNERINILLLGVDDGDPEDSGAPRRSDTMMVASIQPVDKSIAILSIPRDSRVSIPGRAGYEKVAHAFAYGGPTLAVRTVENNFDIPVDYYMVIDWKAFIRVVDILGGVSLNVERNMDYEDPYENLSIHLRKGYQHLNGEQAGEYVRFRHDELGDIGRVQRQETFLKALTSQLLQAGTILKLPALISTVSHYVQTDMNTAALAKVTNVLKDMNSNSLHTQMLPGDFATIDGLSYWMPSASETRKIVDSDFKN